MKPRLSIIVPVSRSPEFVGRLIASLEAQDAEPGLFELVLVVDAPARYASARVAVKVVRSPSRHPCVKRNVGVSAAASDDCLGFVDDDVRLDARWVSRALAAIDGGADVVTGPSNLPYDEGFEQGAANFIVCSRFYSLKKALADPERRSVRFFEVALCNVAMRRKVWAEVEGFNEVAYYWIDDVEFFYIAERLGFRLLNDPEVKAAHWKRPLLGPLMRHYFRQRWYAGLSTWVFPELYLPQAGVALAAVLLILTVRFPWAAPAAFLGVALCGGASFGGERGPYVGVCLALSTAATVLGFWAGLLCGPFFRLGSRTVLRYKSFRYRDRSRPFEGQEIVSPWSSLLRQSVPYRVWGGAAFPQWLIYFVTARCNARCPMCFYLEEINEADRSRELSADEVRRIAASMPPITYLSLSGGEPFLREDIVELVQAFIDSAGPAYVSMPTNGSFPERVERVVDELSRRNPGTVFDVHLSLDGPKDVHDAIRGERSAPYESVMETHRAVLPLFRRRENVSIKFVVTCSSLNSARLEEFLLGLVDGVECDRVNLVPLHGNFKEKSMAVEHERYLALAGKMYGAAERKGHRHFRHRLFYAIKRASDARLKPLMEEGDLGRICGAGRKIAVLGPYGDVLPCEPLRRSVGNLRDFEYDLPKVLAGQGMRDFAQKYLGPGKCHCNWGCAIGNALVQDPSFYPEVGREILKSL